MHSIYSRELDQERHGNSFIVEISTRINLIAHRIGDKEMINKIFHELQDNRYHKASYYISEAFPHAYIELFKIELKKLSSMRKLPGIFILKNMTTKMKVYTEIQYVKLTNLNFLIEEQEQVDMNVLQTVLLVELMDYL